LPYSLSCGRRFRILNVIDQCAAGSCAANAKRDFSGECLATVVDTSRSGRRVARKLDRIADLRGRLCMVVSPSRGLQANRCRAANNGADMTSNAILKWQEERQVEWRLYRA
jgi:putative transposase